MIIWSESLDRIVPLCQEFEERLIKLLWRSRPLFNTPSASLNHYHGGGGGSSGNESLMGSPGSGSVEALALSTVGPDGGNGNRNSTNNEIRLGNGLARVNGSSLALNLHSSNNNTSPSLLKGPYGEQGRDFDELEMDEKDRDKVVSGFDDQKSEDGEKNNKPRGEYRRTWYGKKVSISPSPKHEDDLESYRGEKRPVRFYAPVYNGLAAGIALGMFYSLLIFFAVLTFPG